MLVSDRLKTPWSARQEAGLTVRPWWKCTYSKVGSPGITDPVRVRETGTRAILRGSLSLHCGWVGLERSHFHSKVGFELSSRHLRPCRWSNQGATQRPRRHHTWGPIWAALLLSFLWAIGNIQRMSTSFKMSILHTGDKHLVSEEFPWWLSSKESACKAEVSGSIPGLGRSPGGGHGNPLQYSCLENPMNRGAWQATLHGVTRVGHDWSNCACKAYKMMFTEETRKQNDIHSGIQESKIYT